MTYDARKRHLEKRKAPAVDVETVEPAPPPAAPPPAPAAKPSGKR